MCIPHFSMNCTLHQFITTISFSLCCVLSACKVAPISSEACNDHIDTADPLQLQLITQTHPKDTAPLVTPQILQTKNVDQKIDHTETLAVAVGDDQQLL